MVHKIEASCRMVDLDFNGWVMDPQSNQVRLDLQKGNFRKEVVLPFHTFQVMDVEQLAVKIKGLFVGNPTCL